MTTNPVRVLVVEDSPMYRELLLHILQADPQIRVVGVATDGVMAVEMACRERPDVITMDVHLPKQDGLKATRMIMETCPAPVVIVSASTGYSQQGDKAFRALEAGALTLVSKPPGLGHPKYHEAANELILTLKLMSEVKVVRLWPRAPGVPKAIRPQSPGLASDIRLVAIGASAGGPLALQHILAALPKNFPVSVLIVQHMASGFVEGFVQWLGDSTGFPVHVAVQGEKPLAGHAYVAPSDCHMGIAASGVILLSSDAPECGLRPAVSYFFRSVARTCGRQAIGVLLTGMGRDGAAELKTMKDEGAITIAQDEKSCLVYGMPGEAVQLGAVKHVLSLEDIPAMLISLTTR